MRFAALALALAAPVAAQAPVAAPDLTWLHGEWKGSGQLQGRPTEVNLSIRPVFDGSATALDYRASFTGGSFEGRATYRIGAQGKVTGQWSDSAGSLHLVSGRITGSSLTTVWGSPITELGRSTYMRSGDTLTVTDTVLTPEGGWRTFATASYRRVSS